MFPSSPQMARDCTVGTFRVSPTRHCCGFTATPATSATDSTTSCCSTGASDWGFSYSTTGDTERATASRLRRGLYADAEAAIDFITSDLGLDPLQDVVLYGRSLGVGVAVEMATRHEVRGVVLESGFASVKEMVRLTRPRIPAGLVLPLFDARYDSISKIGRLMSPVMIVHGTYDDTVPFEMAKRLYEAAPEPKRLYAVPGASHNDTYLVGGEGYIQALREFIQDSPGLRDATSP